MKTERSGFLQSSIFLERNNSFSSEFVFRSEVPSEKVADGNNDSKPRILATSELKSPARIEIEKRFKILEILVELEKIREEISKNKGNNKQGVNGKEKDDLFEETVEKEGNLLDLKQQEEALMNSFMKSVDTQYSMAKKAAKEGKEQDMNDILDNIRSVLNQAYISPLTLQEAYSMRIRVGEYEVQILFEEMSCNKELIKQTQTEERFERIIRDYLFLVKDIIRESNEQEKKTIFNRVIEILHEAKSKELLREETKREFKRIIDEYLWGVQNALQEGRNGDKTETILENAKNILHKAESKGLLSPEEKKDRLIKLMPTSKRTGSISI